jgi:hypothetical protein
MHTDTTLIWRVLRVQNYQRTPSKLCKKPLNLTEVDYKVPLGANLDPKPHRWGLPLTILQEK